MKFTLPLRHGLSAAWHHKGLVFLLYLAALLPALVAGLVVYGRLAAATGGSLFAHRAFAAGNLYGILDDFGRGHPGDLQALETLLPIFVVLAVLVHVLFAAGLVEALLQREAKREHPFLLGVGRHSWRFVRSGVWFLLLLTPTVVVLAAVFNLGVNELAIDLADTRVQAYGLLGVVALGVLLLAFLDLAYDLSRIAAATHDEGRTFVGFFKALGHAFAHPVMLLPVWFFFSLLVAGLHLGATALHDDWRPAGLGEVLGLLALQQLVFLLAAYFRVGLWGAEVAYYQAVGEPRWCGKRPRRQIPQVEHRKPLPVEHRESLPVDRPAEPAPTPSWEQATPLGQDGEDDEADGTGPRAF